MNKERSFGLFPPPFLPTASPEKIRELLETQKGKGEELLKNPLLPLDEVQSWTLLTKEILLSAFGPAPEYIDSIIYAGDQKAYSGYEPESALEKERRKNFQLTLDGLEGCLARLNSDDPESFPSESDEIDELPKSGEISMPFDEAPSAETKGERPLPIINGERPARIAPKAPPEKETGSPKVLILPGRAEEGKRAVEEFLTRLGVEPVGLQGGAGSGGSLIEGLSGRSDPAFSVVLLTGDDCGYPKGKPQEAKPRPGQKTLFELGFLTGRLPQNQVCALYEEGLELPSEYAPGLFIPMDAGGLWKLLLARAMKIAKVDVDLNKAL